MLLGSILPPFEAHFAKEVSWKIYPLYCEGEALSPERR
jgi:hypothetical protein